MNRSGEHRAVQILSLSSLSAPVSNSNGLMSCLFHVFLLNNSPGRGGSDSSQWQGKVLIPPSNFSETVTAESLGACPPK